MTFPWGSYQVYVPNTTSAPPGNPGCITFNETTFRAQRPRFSEHQRRAGTTLHEVCHMWFGDLAASWWDDTSQLQESFAENQGASAIATATRYVGEWANFAMNHHLEPTQDQMPKPRTRLPPTFRTSPLRDELRQHHLREEVLRS